MQRLKDIGLTQYELNNGEQNRGPSARWYWDPRYIAPLFEDEEALDITTLREIDKALTRLCYIARWKHYIRQKYKRKVACQDSNPAYPLP